MLVLSWMRVPQIGKQQAQKAKEYFIHEWNRIGHDQVDHEQDDQQGSELRESKFTSETEQTASDRIGHDRYHGGETTAYVLSTAIESEFMYERFSGIDRLYGQGTLDHLAKCSVAVIGLGGVGSWAAEALARSGVGALTLIDADEICVSNTNRQLHALDGQYGRTKVVVMAERLRAISPALNVHAVERFLTPPTLEELLDHDYDLVLDACDAFRVKVEMIAWCRRRKLPLITVGSAGGRSDPTQIRIRDLSRTEQDSLENVRYPQTDGSVCGNRPAEGDSLGLDCGGGLGAATHVTGAFAFAAVGRALELLLKGRA